MADAQQTDQLRDLVATVSAAYFSNVHVTKEDIPSVIATIATSLQQVGAEAAPEAASAPEEVAPTKASAAQIRKSITQDGLVSFEDGKTYKTLKRHLSTRGLSVAEYRAKWGLPADYPMVAPAYSAARSKLAKAAGLGRKAGESRPRRGGRKA
jgi:predicted transcriptional regulator